MIVPIIGRSAAEFWLGPAAAYYTKYAFNNQQELKTFPDTFDYQITSEVCKLVAGKLLLSLPLETFSYNHAHHQHEKASHVLTRYRPFPENSFVFFKLCGLDIAVARPELCFIQAARKLDVAHLVYLGIKLCGIYYINTQPNGRLENEDEPSQKSRSPITNLKLMNEYLKNASGEYGIKIAREAVKYIVEGANSPMESAIATIMILPWKYAGFGIPRFTMNDVIGLSEEAAKYFGYPELRGDFFWEKSKIIGEYNSRAYHLNSKQQTKDANRLNAMQQSGYHVVPITYDDLKYYSSVEKTMAFLMDELKRPDLKIGLQENREFRKKLCMELLGTKPDFYENYQK